MPRANGNGLSNNQSRIFVDSDALIALAVDDDTIRPWAERTSGVLQQQNAQLFTSNFVFGEVVTLVSQKLGLRRARESVELVESTCFVIDAVANHRQEAIRRFFAQPSKNARFTDCINMAMMDELGIDTIFSHDIHYKKAGYKRLEID